MTCFHFEWTSLTTDYAHGECTEHVEAFGVVKYTSNAAFRTLEGNNKYNTFNIPI